MRHKFLNKFLFLRFGLSLHFLSVICTPGLDVGAPETTEDVPWDPHTHCSLHVPQRVIQRIPFPVKIECRFEEANHDSVVKRTLLLLIENEPPQSMEVFLYLGRGVASIVVSALTRRARIALGGDTGAPRADVTVLSGGPDSFCGTNMSGVLAENSLEWPQDSVVCVTGPLIVPQHCTLRIHQGVTVVFVGLQSIVVDGILEVIGTESNPVLFVPGDTGGVWGTILLQGQRGVSSVLLHGWFLRGGGDESQGVGHSRSQPIIHLLSTEMVMAGGGFLDSPGKALFAFNSSVTMHRTMTARCDTGGEFHYSVLEMSEAHVVEIPDAHILDGTDDDNDALYFFYKHRSGRPSRVLDSVLMRGHDDGIDHNDADVHVVRTHIEEFLHEGIAASNAGSVLVINSSIARCWHGVEVGFCEINEQGVFGASSCNASVGLCSTAGPRVRMVGGSVRGCKFGVYMGDDYHLALDRYPGRLELVGVELIGNEVTVGVEHLEQEERVVVQPRESTGLEQEPLYLDWERETARCDCGSLRLGRPLSASLLTYHKKAFSGSCHARPPNYGARGAWDKAVASIPTVVLAFRRFIEQQPGPEYSPSGEGPMPPNLAPYLLELLSSVVPWMRHPSLSHALAVCAPAPEEDELAEAAGGLLLVFRHAKGERLDQLQGGSGLDGRGVLEFALTLAEGVAFLQGGSALGPMFHRDLAPRNVMLLSSRAALVMDWEEAALSRFTRPLVWGPQWPRLGAKGNPTCNRNHVPYEDMPAWASPECRKGLAGYDVEAEGFEQIEVFNVGVLVQAVLRSTSAARASEFVDPIHGYVAATGEEPRHDFSGSKGGLRSTDFPDGFEELLNRALGEGGVRPSAAGLVLRLRDMLSLNGSESVCSGWRSNVAAHVEEERLEREPRVAARGAGAEAAQLLERVHSLRVEESEERTAGETAQRALSTERWLALALLAGWSADPQAWMQVLRDGVVVGVDSFKYPTWQLSRGGGSFRARLHVPSQPAAENSTALPDAAWGYFKSTDDHDEAHGSEIAMHVLDRVLGLAVTAPCVRRELDLAELASSAALDSAQAEELEVYAAMQARYVRAGKLNGSLCAWFTAPVSFGDSFPAPRPRTSALDALPPSDGSLPRGGDGTAGLGVAHAVRRRMEERAAAADLLVSVGSCFRSRHNRASWLHGSQVWDQGSGALLAIALDNDRCFLDRRRFMKTEHWTDSQYTESEWDKGLPQRCGELPESVAEALWQSLAAARHAAAESEEGGEVRVSAERGTGTGVWFAALQRELAMEELDVALLPAGLEAVELQLQRLEELTVKCQIEKWRESRMSGHG